MGLRAGVDQTISQIETRRMSPSLAVSCKRRHGIARNGVGDVHDALQANDRMPYRPLPARHRAWSRPSSRFRDERCRMCNNVWPPSIASAKSRASGSLVRMATKTDESTNTSMPPHLVDVVLAHFARVWSDLGGEVASNRCVAIGQGSSTAFTLHPGIASLTRATNPG